MTARRVAVVDQGSNSTRLFLCEGLGPDGPIGTRQSTVTALRHGAAADGTLAPDAIERMHGVLVGMGREIDAFGPDAVIVIATSAVRDAPNAPAVCDLIEDALGVVPTVVSGAEEAELSYAGARLAVDGHGPATVVDIGGGSTEIVRGGPAGPHHAVSLDIGVVRHTQAFLVEDPPAPDSIDALFHDIRDQIRECFAVVGVGAPIIGVAGTVTSLAAITLGAYRPEIIHRSWLSATDVRGLRHHLQGLTVDQRRDIPGLHPDRAPAIVAGACILEAILDADGGEGVIVSERDLLDGAALRLLGADG